MSRRIVTLVYQPLNYLGNFNRALKHGESGCGTRGTEIVSTDRRVRVTADRHFGDILANRQEFSAHRRHHMQTKQVLDLAEIILAICDVGFMFSRLQADLLVVGSLRVG